MIRDYCIIFVFYLLLYLLIVFILMALYNDKISYSDVYINIYEKETLSGYAGITINCYFYQQIHRIPLGIKWPIF